MADRAQVGLTEDADAKLQVLKEDSPYFSEGADVYRLAVGVALALDADVSEHLRRQTLVTKYRVVMEDSDETSARLDSSDGKLARLVALLKPDFADEPYRNSQYLAVIGINYLHGEIIEKGSSLHQALADLRGS